MTIISFHQQAFTPSSSSPVSTTIDRSSSHRGVDAEIDRRVRSERWTSSGGSCEHHASPVGLPGSVGALTHPASVAGEETDIDPSDNVDTETTQILD